MAKIIKVSSDVQRSAPDGIVTMRSLDTSAKQNSLLPSEMQAIVDDAYKASPVFTSYPKIETVEELRQLLAQLVIRFDTRPDYYTKKDYQLLIALISGTLQHVFGTNMLSSENEDVLIVEQTAESGKVLKPQLGTLQESDEDANGAYTGTDNNESKIVTIGDIRNYINNKLTWIEK